MKEKTQQKQRYIVHKGLGEPLEICFNWNVSNRKTRNKRSSYKNAKNKKNEALVIKLKTQGSSSSLENNCDDNDSRKYDRGGSSFSTISNCFSSNEGTSENDRKNCSNHNECENASKPERFIGNKEEYQKKKCFGSFSENSSFYVHSGSSDLDGSLFNNICYSGVPDDIQRGKKKNAFTTDNKEMESNKTDTDTFNFLMKNCIHLLSLNAYLYNDIFLYNPHLYGLYESCRNNDIRCEYIAKLCAQFDLIFLRSVYGKYQMQFYQKLKNTHTVLLDTDMMSPNVNYIAECFYTFQNYIGGNGGLFVCWRKKDFRLTFYDFMYLTCDILLKRKVIKIIKLKYKEWYNLYFVHTEFDLFSTNNKWSNLEDLIMLIKKTLWKIYVLRIFYKNKRFFKRKKEVQRSSNEMDKKTLIKEIQRFQKEREDNFQSESSDIGNKEKERVVRNIIDKKEIYTELIFKKTSMFILGSFNIDRKEMKEMYEKFITLNDQGVLKDLFFYKNIHYKMQDRYSIVDRENSFVGGLNYCFGLTDNVFLLDQFTFNKKSIEEMFYLFHPIDIIKESLQQLKKTGSDYILEDVLLFINRNCIIFKFQNVFNFGVDILTQKKGSEFSDHWAISAQFLLNRFNKKENIHVEQYLHNFLSNVHKHFVIKKNRYSSLCEVNSTVYKDEKDQKYKQDWVMKRPKYDYSKKCIIAPDNVQTFFKMDKALVEAMKRCFQL